MAFDGLLRSNKGFGESITQECEASSYLPTRLRLFAHPVYTAEGALILICQTASKVKVCNTYTIRIC